MIRMLTRWTDRLCPVPLREGTGGPWGWWRQALQRTSGFYTALLERRRHSAPPAGLTQIHLEPTNLCNLSCRTCYQRRQSAPRGMMPLDLARKVIDQALEAVGPDCILGFYIRGEATLHPRLVEMLRYAQGRGMRRLLLSTNLTRLNRGLARDLLAAGVSELRLSIDGADRQVFESSRRGACFGQVCRAVEMLEQERRRLSSPCTFRLHAALGESQFHKVPAFVRRWDRVVQCFKFTVAVNQGGLLETEEASRLSGMRFATSREFQIPCRILYNYAGVTWDGKITSCCVDYDEHFVVGHIDEGLDNVFRNSRSRRLRADHLAGHLGPVCRACGFANALVDWFEDEVNGYVEANRKRFHQQRFDGQYRTWLQRTVEKFNEIAGQFPARRK